MQHLVSNYREGGVADEVSDEDLLYRGRQGLDVGTVAQRRVSQRDWSSFWSQSFIDPEHTGADRRYPTTATSALETGADLG